MAIKQLHKAVKSEAFRPCTLSLADGRRLSVPYPDLALISRGAVFVLLAAASLSAGPRTDLYSITSGRYSVVGGIGPLAFDLPVSAQAYVAITVDPDAAAAELSILGTDLEPWNPSWLGSPTVHGTVQGGNYRFYGTVLGLFDAVGTLDYIVGLDGESLALYGQVEFPLQCCDIPYLFEHRNVQAALVPEPITGVLLLVGLAISVRRTHGRRQGLKEAGHE